MGPVEQLGSPGSPSQSREAGGSWEERPARTGTRLGGEGSRSNRMSSSLVQTSKGKPWIMSLGVRLFFFM